MIAPEPPFELTTADRLSPTWLRLREHMESRLQAARVKNDHPLSEQQTAEIRGAIRCLKELINLGNDPAIRPVDVRGHGNAAS